MKKYDFKVFPIIETERLLLRQLEISDDNQIFKYQSNKENFEFVDMPVYTEVSEAQKYVEKMNKGVSSNQWIIWAITDKSTSDMIGTISIWNISKEDSKAEVGLGLFQGFRGKGFMTEALIKVIEFGINEMGLETIEAYTNKLNSKSRALLENNSFVKVKSFTETETLCGKGMEMIVYKYSK